MATAETQTPPAEATAPALPDYVLDEDAVLKDTGVKWRYGQAPDYSKTRKMYSESKHDPSLSPYYCQRARPKRRSESGNKGRRMKREMRKGEKKRQEEEKRERKGKEVWTNSIGHSTTQPSAAPTQPAPSRT
jgi:hypothetical protein